LIELAMVHRMLRRGAVIALPLTIALSLWGGSRYGFSGLVGIAMTLLNLWLSAKLIGGVADNNPRLLFPVGLVTFGAGLAMLTGIALVLRAADLVYFPVTGIVLVATHLLLVLWEAAGAHARVEPAPGERAAGSAVRARG
jgi:hypothetical protein